ncbi:3D-(3,5/4)-trihydroxycyclohexane-1,2-dione hydrolase [Cedecea neteri]|uniref:3D-(3,5/4)-trihydroxycyclohexane-1,2-dione hydrolase n=1 Tax=Cedecea neteri TaxID=158822 RepID=A0A2X2TFM8_9ENTR|nr:3D-(3,5/4)-trihydroxycyclohexane-1,2-dione hydrolase [Cedecea neteri]
MERFGLPFAETQAGKGAIVSEHSLNLGGLGVTGGLAANRLAPQADLIIGVGTRPDRLYHRFQIAVFT